MDKDMQDSFNKSCEQARLWSVHPTCDAVVSVNRCERYHRKKIVETSYGIRFNLVPEKLYSWIYTPVAFFRNGERISLTEE